MKPREQAVQRLFSRIARYYDLLNTVISFGLHGRWRRAAVTMLAPQPGWRCLDLCAGTGEFAIAVQRLGASPVAVDITPEMLQVACRRTSGELSAVVADGFALPFPDASFDCATLGFALRHSREDLVLFLRELRRVIKPGGRVMSLELSHPPNRLWRFLSGLYIRLFLPIIGGVYDRAAYRYLSKSLEGFPDAPGLARVFIDAGFTSCEYRLLAGGNAAIHLAIA